MTRRSSRGRERAALTPDEEAAAGHWLDTITTDPADGTTFPPPPGTTSGQSAVITFDGASDIGAMPDDVTFISISRPWTGPIPLNDYQAAPASFPALPPAAPRARDILPAVPVTQPAVIGDSLRIPVLWCEGRCITWFHDPDALGERDNRDRAQAAGWRTDAFGRLTCPACQRTDPGFRATAPVVRSHPGLRRRKLSALRSGIPLHEAVSRDDEKRLSAQADYWRRLRVEDPVLARDVAGASDRGRAS